MCTHPGLLVECCLLMALNPTAFIERTLPFTLPQLYGNCEAKVLQKIAKDLGIQSSALFLESSAIILAHIFRLQGPGQTNKALAFVVKILIDEKGKEGIAINPQHIVLSCIVSLTAELVIGMGDDPGKAAVVSLFLKLLILPHLLFSQLLLCTKSNVVSHQPPTNIER